MKLVWLTDVHLNFISDMERSDYYHEIRNRGGDVILITGDIAEAPSISIILQEMASIVGKNIYYILGNHDYYHSQVQTVRNSMRALTQNHPLLFWLPAMGPVTLEEGILLIGQDGWADGRFGNFDASPVVVNDSRMIADLFQQRLLGKKALLHKMQQLADEDAHQLRNQLEEAIMLHPKKILVLTHVPPFQEACMHEGKLTNENYLPFFSSKVTGDVLTEYSTQFPSIKFQVLCGHTHDACQLQVSNNLHVWVGKSDYYLPSIQSVINTSSL